MRGVSHNSKSVSKDEIIPFTPVGIRTRCISGCSARVLGKDARGVLIDHVASVGSGLGISNSHCLVMHSGESKEGYRPRVAFLVPGALSGYPCGVGIMFTAPLTNSALTGNSTLGRHALATFVGCCRSMSTSSFGCGGAPRALGTGFGISKTGVSAVLITRG